MVSGTDIYKEFLALAKTTTTGATVTAAAVDEAGVFPQVVVNYPMFPRKRYTYGTTNYNRDGMIDIIILAESSRNMKEVLEDIQDILFANYKSSTSVSDLEVDIGDPFREDIGGNSAHSIVLTFNL